MEVYLVLDGFGVGDVVQPFHSFDAGADDVLAGGREAAGGEGAVVDLGEVRGQELG